MGSSRGFEALPHSSCAATAREGAHDGVRPNSGDSSLIGAVIGA